MVSLFFTVLFVVVNDMKSGSMAFYLGKKAEEFSTHRWVIYVRGPQGEDISAFIEKVTFSLHPSFPDPVRGETIEILDNLE